MHELPVTERILDIALNHAAKNAVTHIVSITLTIGELSDLESECIQQYFDFLSKDTIAAGAILKVEKVPICLKCGHCGETIQVSKEDLGNAVCPGCNASTNFSIVSGREYFIKELEAQ